jgi:hypothetical protein
LIDTFDGISCWCFDFTAQRFVVLEVHWDQFSRKDPHAKLLAQIVAEARPRNLDI